MDCLAFAGWDNWDGLEVHGVAVTTNTEPPFHNLGPPSLQLNEFRTIEPQGHFRWPTGIFACTFLPIVLHLNSSTVCVPLELVTCMAPAKLSRARWI